MPKTAAFDEQDVLKKLRSLFREKGYNGTTLKDLCRATGLNPGSLYNSFGNKEELFCRAVRSYNDAAIDLRIVRFLKATPGSPLEGLERFVRSTFSGDEKNKIGCLITNSIAELDALPKSAHEDIVDGTERLEKGFRLYLEDEIKVNKIKLRLGIQETARFLFVHYQGFLTLVKLKKSYAQLDSYLKTILIPILTEGKNSG